MIYLDNASTTKMDEKVLQEMLPYMLDDYGNPGGQYPLGFHARKAVRIARKQVADFIHAMPEQIIFTGNGSEANNLVIRAVHKRIAALDYSREMHSAILSSETEHDSMLNALRNSGCTVSYFHTESGGYIDAERAKEEIECQKPVLVTVMRTNNETGVRNPVEEIGEFCQSRGILFHTDCVQGAACEPLDVDSLHCDMLSLSAHKLHGPKGIGALYVRYQALLEPLIYGGSNQEFGLRGGTENVAAIVGFGKACERMTEEGYEKTDALGRLFWYSLRDEMNNRNLGSIRHDNGSIPDRFPKTQNMRFDGVDAETLVLNLGARGVAVSAGSACRSLEQEPSYVLKAMGLTDEQARSSIRFSVSRMNTEDEMKQAARIIAETVADMKKAGESQQEY